MADAATTAAAIAAAASEVGKTAEILGVVNSALIVTIFGYTINLMTVAIIAVFIGLLALAWGIQKSGRLDFADMLTKDGRKVSATKVLQLLGGISSTWFIVKTGLQGTLSSEIFAIYLTYCASIEGFSKFISAKYNYKERSVRDADPNAVSEDGPIKETTSATIEDGHVTKLEKTTEKGIS